MHITPYRTLDAIIIVLLCFDVPPWRREPRMSERGEYCLLTGNFNVLTAKESEELIIY